MRILKTIAICFLMAPTLIQAQGIEFSHGTWAEIKAKSKAEDKLIFFDANTSWCGPCKWMAANAFVDEKVGDFFNKNFISYELDMEKGEGIELAKEFKISLYPTLLFLNSEGEIVHKGLGALDAEKFLALGEIAADPDRNFAGMERRYQNGDRSKEFIRDYMLSLKQSGKTRKEVLDWYFYGMSDEELLTKENFEVINNHISSTANPQFIFLLNHKADFAKVTSEKEVTDKIYDVYRSSLFGALYSNDDVKWEIAKAEVKASTIEQPEKLLANADIYYYSRKKEWGNYIKAVDHYATTFEADNWNSFNSYAWGVYLNKNITDLESLKTALKWINQSIKLNSCYANNDTKAALLKKMGDKKGAIKAANKAIALAGSDDDVSGTKKLIEELSK